MKVRRFINRQVDKETSRPVDQYTLLKNAYVAEELPGQKIDNFMMMEKGILTKYSASAGSGKTYKLTGIYLSKLFGPGTAYRKILAVTFTNKAAADMKRKILGQLYSIASKEKSDMAAELSEVTGLCAEELSEKAGAILHSILHDYSGFSVGTIDSFFQKVLKAFTREIGLQQGYLIELDHDQILARAVDDTIAATADDKALRDWISDYARERVQEGKSWNLREEIRELAGEIFKEKFRLMPKEEKDKLRNRDFLNGYARELRAVMAEFEGRLGDYYDRCRAILDKYNVSDDMFLRGARGGVGSFLNLIKNSSSGGFEPLNTIVSQVLEDPPVWCAKTGPSPQLKMALGGGFAALFLETLHFYTANYHYANTAAFICENIYILGILSDILENVHNVTTAGNRFLLSDAGELLWLIIGNDQTPFIYEKTGSSYEHFMIDEFQDTSLIQWNNFLPLIGNSMAEGHNNLVVGDVKQSIYRWRNSDWKILGSLIHSQFEKSRLKTEHLDTNWRSKKNIIAFNNSLFSVLPRIIDESELNTTGSMLLGQLYSDALQKYPGKRDGGHVRIEFLKDAETPFEELALARLPELIEKLYDEGYSGADIGILVRTNREGAAVLNSMLEYKSQAEPEKLERYNYNLISNESLFLSSSPAVEFIITVLSGFYNTGDEINRAAMLRSWLLATGQDPLAAEISDLPAELERLLPEGYKKFLEKARRMPLFEAVENIVSFFGLCENVNNTAFLNSFQDYALEFSINTGSDIPSFLEWWETTGTKKSVILPDQQDAVRVMTIHKAKGLEFRVVIVPFISWNLGHGRQAPTLWLNPPAAPFSMLGLVPVKYKSALQHSFFAGDYQAESYHALVDNLNLLYVAFTRAVDGLYGFAPAEGKKNSISSAILGALNSNQVIKGDKPGIPLSEFFSGEESLFDYGSLPVKPEAADEKRRHDLVTGKYYVNIGINRLRLRFNGENWLLPEKGERLARINYGKLMHRIFESVITIDDIPCAVESMVADGRIPVAEKDLVMNKINNALKSEQVRGWFSHGLDVRTEASVLLKDGALKRPDRVISDCEKVTVIDFKFGEEKNEYKAQVSAYKKLMISMGYKKADAFIWYVDNNKVVQV